MKRFFATALLSSVVLLPQTGPAADRKGKADKLTPKEALQALNAYIGSWKGDGSLEKNPSTIWKETLSWSWRFKGDDAWLNFEIKDGKFFKGGELRYLPEKKKYQLTMTDVKDQNLVFEGELDKK